MYCDFEMTLLMPLLYLGDTVGEIQCQNSDMTFTCFSSFFFFITTYFESNTAVGRYLKQHAWRGKKHISKFVKEINWMLLTQDIFPKKLWPVCMQLE